ncbi:hypothetical protein pEaSNUABM55_00244 [Erwinia phage pEa_SNUABM_55]|nr:hypothetical protein pEaSNUABM55_00244 [Erwinia phage pEa_SNUABM_55]
MNDSAIGVILALIIFGGICWGMYSTRDKRND